MSQVKEIIAYEDSTGEFFKTIDEALYSQVYINIYKELETLEKQVDHSFTDMQLDSVREYIVSNRKALLAILSIGTKDVELEMLKK